MIATVTTAENALSVAWAAGGPSRFPYLWLRDNCGCALCRDPRNGQRLCALR
jgi:gamma-butyrobetaine dioxygenase